MTSSTAASFSEVNTPRADLIALIVQELQSSLTIILGYADLLFDRNQSTSDHEGYLLAIKHSGRRLITLMNDIGDLSRIESGQIEVQRVRVCPVSLVEEVLQQYQDLARAKGLSLAAQPIGPTPQTILSDPLRMRQILFNLVGNAIKFTETGGIVVVVRMADFEGRGPKMAIDVIDTGIGIGAQRIRQIFSPVVHSDRSQKSLLGSSGLGLVVSRRLAYLLGGDLAVTSSLGHGSTFTWTMATGPLEGIPILHHRDDAAACIQRKLRSIED